MSETNGEPNVLANGLKLVGEMFVPGGAELLQGRLGSGIIHNLLAGAAALTLGSFAGLAVFAIKADSFVRSVKDQSLLSAASSALSDGVRGAGGIRADKPEAPPKPRST